eukprot:COSAG01_NODE_6209_length_3793_cov_40.520032_2_plen_284_part_00
MLHSDVRLMYTQLLADFRQQVRQKLSCSGASRAGTAAPEQCKSVPPDTSCPIWQLAYVNIVRQHWRHYADAVLVQEHWESLVLAMAGLDSLKGDRELLGVACGGDRLCVGRSSNVGADGAGLSAEAGRRRDGAGSSSSAAAAAAAAAATDERRRRRSDCDGRTPASLTTAFGWVQALRTMSVLASVAGQPRAVAARWHDRHGVAVRRAFPSFVTEIYLCHTCSCHEILRVDTPGQVQAWHRAYWDGEKQVRGDEGMRARSHHESGCGRRCSEVMVGDTAVAIG